MGQNTLPSRFVSSCSSGVLQPKVNFSFNKSIEIACRLLFDLNETLLSMDAPSRTTATSTDYCQFHSEKSPSTNPLVEECSFSQPSLNNECWSDQYESVSCTNNNAECLHVNSPSSPQQQQIASSLNLVMCPNRGCFFHKSTTLPSLFFSSMWGESRMSHKLDDQDSGFDSSISDYVGGASLVLCDKAALACCLDIDTIDQMGTTLNQHVQHATHKLEMAIKAQLVALDGLQESVFGPRAILPVDYKCEHVDVAVPDVQDFDSQNKQNDAIPSSHFLWPETLEQWELYNRSRSASAYIFLRLLDGLACELHRHICETSEELHAIQECLQLQGSVSSQFTCADKFPTNKNCGVSLTIPTATTTSTTDVSTWKTSTNQASHDYNKGRQTPSTTPSTNTPSTTSPSTNRSSAPHTSTSTPSSMTSETTKQSETPQGFSGFHGGSTSNSPASQSPYTPPLNRIDVNAESPPKLTKQNMDKKNDRRGTKDETVYGQADSKLDGHADQTKGSFDREETRQEEQSNNQEQHPTEPKKSYDFSGFGNKLGGYIGEGTGNVNSVVMRESELDPSRYFIQSMSVKGATSMVSENNAVMMLNAGTQALEREYKILGKEVLDALVNRSRIVKNKSLHASECWTKFKNRLVEVSSRHNRPRS